MGLILWFLGIELAMVFGLLAFILNFIPNVGSIIATLLPLPMVLVHPEFSWFMFLAALFVPGTIQMVIGNVLEPKMLGESLELHPITVLLSLIFWGILWGIPGMLLAAPITAVLKILLEHLELTKPLARLLEGDFQTEETPIMRKPEYEQTPSPQSSVIEETEKPSSQIPHEENSPKEEPLPEAPP